MACLLANHGLLACGADLGGAETLAVEVEHLCEAYLEARAAGTPAPPSEAEIGEALARFDAYRRGQTRLTRPAGRHGSASPLRRAWRARRDPADRSKEDLRCCMV
jgi:L-fuculose-phosphate aldolase